jgi:replication factor A1
MEGNYEQLIDFIAENAGISRDEIERKIEAKQAKLAGLISKEGAAQVIAAELNVNFDKQFIKLSQIVPGMRKINLVGKIIQMNPVREYSKNGREGRVGSFVLADETSNMRVVLWDENHIDFIVNGEIAQDRSVEIANASIRNGELHLTSFSEIKPADKVFESVVLEKPLVRKNIREFNSGEQLATRGFIVQMFEPRFFEVCPECRKKVNELGECNEHGKVAPEKRALLNFVIDDGTDSIRGVLFADQISKIMTNEELENPELFSLKKNDLVGKEMIFSGNVRKNAMFQNLEFIINDIIEVNLDQLIVELEK